MKYSEIKKSIYHFYTHFKKVDIDNIEEVNDHIISEDLKTSDFEDPLKEFYITVAMCSYMIDNDLYDDYFFNAYKELIEENKLVYDEDINTDLEKINEYLKKDEIKSEYYEKLSELYNK